MPSAGTAAMMWPRLIVLSIRSPEDSPGRGSAMHCSGRRHVGRDSQAPLKDVGILLVAAIGGHEAFDRAGEVAQHLAVQQRGLDAAVLCIGEDEVHDGVVLYRSPHTVQTRPRS